jgi:hypothetical protein
MVIKGNKEGEKLEETQALDLDDIDLIKAYVNNFF